MDVNDQKMTKNKKIIDQLDACDLNAFLSCGAAIRKADISSRTVSYRELLREGIFRKTLSYTRIQRCT